MTHTSTEQPSLEAIIHDLRASHDQATAGTWGKGATTHETVSRTEGKQPYKVADFRHSNDAQFCDLAHAFTPRLIAEVESLQKRVQELEEIERLLAERDDLLENGKQAVRWAPSSAHWSNELKRLFGEDAREGIDALEARLRAAQAERDALRDALETMVEMVEMNGFGKSYAMDVASAAIVRAAAAIGENQA